MKHPQGAKLRLSHRHFLATPWHTRGLSVDQVPPLPPDAEFLSETSHDTACYQKDDCRWRFSLTEPERIMVFIRYRSDQERAAGLHPWAERYVDEAA